MLRDLISTVDKKDILNFLDFGTETTLFDDDRICWKISLSYLDTKINTTEKFNNFVQKIKKIDELVIENDRENSSNPIIKKYADESLKQYLACFKVAKTNVKILFA